MRTVCRPVSIATIALVVFLAASTNAALVTFEQATRGGLPDGWQAMLVGTGDPKWSVVDDASAPSPRFVLKQSGWTPNPSYPLCAKTNVSIKDGFVEVRFKPLSGTNDQAAGLVWRLRDASNYYVARANALENNVVLYKVEQGKRKSLDIVGRQGGYGVAARVPANQWSTFRVEFAGPRFKVLLNAQELFAVEDATFSEPGAVGVWTKADSVVLFDDFRFDTNSP